MTILADKKDANIPSRYDTMLLLLLSFSVFVTVLVRITLCLAESPKDEMGTLGITGGGLNRRDAVAVTQWTVLQH